MASKPTVRTEETLLQKDATMTVVEDPAKTKPMDTNSSSVIPVVLSTDGEVVYEGEASAAVVTAASSSVTKGDNIAALEGQVKCCIGRSNKEMSWGFCSEQGKRPTMEDFLVIKPGFMKVCCKDVGGCTAPDCEYAMEKSPVHCFGVFDGHGGDQVSNYCAIELCEIVAKEWEKGSNLDGWKKRWEVAFCNAYERVDNVFKDEALAPKSVGSTALVLIVSPCQIIAANCGDSRTVLCRGAQAIPLTIDHKPNRADESKRITSNGGKILYWECSRVEGILSMSRAIGDHDLKAWVISIPEVTFTTRTEEDEFLVLASDGLWDVLSNENIVKLARTELRRQRRLARDNSNRALPPAYHVSHKILKKAIVAHNHDNISVIVVDLKNPKLTSKTSFSSKT